MDHASREASRILATRKGTISPTALSTLRVMALLDPIRVHPSLFESVFTAKYKELKLDFPETAVAYKEACGELVKALLIQFSRKDEAYAMKPEMQTSVLVDLQTAGLLAPIFDGIVKVLFGLWPQMVCVPDREVDQEEIKVATAPGTSYEEYLKKRYLDSRLPLIQEFEQYANVNIWGRRDELVNHVARLEHVFYHSNDATKEICATVPFAMLLVEASWYYLERSNCLYAGAIIESALRVYDLSKQNSPLHFTSIHRVQAAIASESKKPDEAAKYINMQMGCLRSYDSPQGDDLKGRELLVCAPDAIISSWDNGVPPGYFVILPFRSVRNFGFRLYLSARDERDYQYPVYLRHAETCFSAALEDRKRTNAKTKQYSLRMGELHYSLGNVASKSASFLGKAHVYESIEHYEDALRHFRNADAGRDRSAASIAETQYKLAAQFIKLQDYLSALRHNYQAQQYYSGKPECEPHLARLFFQRSRILKLTDNSDMKVPLNRAFSIRRAIRPDDKRSADELTEADFDELVGLWER